MELLGQRTIHSGWGRFLMLSVRMAGGAVVERQLDDHGSASAVLPYDAGRKVALLVRQPRAGPLFLGEDPMLLEAAAGIIDPGETGESTAQREAMEEVGVRLGALESVTRAFSCPGVSSEVMHLYLAPYAAEDRVAAGGGLVDEHEEIEVLELPLAEVARLADAGAVRDLKTLVLIQALRLRRPELFL